MKPAPAKSDIDLLQGPWAIASLEMDGRSVAADSLTDARIEVKGTRFRSVGMGAVYEGEIALDPGVRPKSFDLTFTNGPERGNVNPGIYEIEEDGWKLCLATRGGARPKKFATKAGTGHALEVLRRAPAASKTAKTAIPKAPAASNASTELEGEWSLVSGYMNGKPMDDVMIQYGVRAFRGNRTTLKFGPQTYIDAAFTLVAAGAIDYAHTRGMYAGKTQLGIYECDGSTLKLSTAPPGAARPTNFEMRGPNTVSIFKKR